jgi:type VI secretion system protein ImpJ
MFLRPHHFQIAEQYNASLAHIRETFDQHHYWGLRSIDLDLDALANYRLVVKSLKARMRDGTLVNVPEDGALSDIDLRPSLESAREAQVVTVYLGLPLFQPGQANVSRDMDGNRAPEGGGRRPARYFEHAVESLDVNTGDNPQLIPVRLPNLKLLLDVEAGYEVLPIARIQKSSSAESTPQVDVTYIPPVLACDGWKPLQALVQSVYDRLGRISRQHASQVTSRGISFDSHAQGESRLFEQLRVLNESYAALSIMAFAAGVHPFWAYLELCRLVGKLAIFDEVTRRPPDLPRYDHDDLGGCFYKVKQYIDALLDQGNELSYEERFFVGAGLRMQVALEAKWLEPGWQMFVGVKSPLKAEECIRLLTRGVLQMKLASSDRVDEIFAMGMAGLRFAHAPQPPRALPTELVYFQISRTSQPEEWGHVQRLLSLAIRLNEHLIAGNIQGERTLAIRAGGSTPTTMQFTLYVVPDQAA